VIGLFSCQAFHFSRTGFCNEMGNGDNMPNEKTAWHRRLCLGLVVGLGSALLCASGAAAHPHVWVNVEAVINFDKGAITSIKHKWSFDELYSAMAVEGLEKNKEGKLGREELAELAKVNMEGLKEFNYFTFPTLQGQELKVTDPTDYWLEYKDEVLSLHFTLPLARPVLADAKGFAFQVTDPSFFIAFELAKTNPVKLAEGAPKTCRLNIGGFKQEVAPKPPGEAWFAQLGAMNFGFSMAQPIQVDCSDAP
jgi:ABC-type uncharacterized transport system substrate-binding protein